MNQDIIQQVNEYKEQLSLTGSPLETIIKLRKLTSKEVNPPLQEIIQSEICPQLIAIMDNSTSSEILMESLWILTNVCSGSTIQTQYIINIGGIATFLKYVSHENEDVMAQALWGLGNVAGDSSVNRDLVLQQGAVEIVLKQLERKNIKLANQRTIVWVISNFCRGKPHPKYEMVRPCIFYLGKAIENYQLDTEIITDSLWGINYLSEADCAIEDLINYGILQNICKNYLSSAHSSILTPAVRIIGNVATSKDTYVDFLLQQNVLPSLIALFVHAKKGYRKESLWTVSNIMAGTEAQILKVLQQPNFFQNLISNRNQPIDVKKEMYFVISNSLNVSKACQFFLKNNILNCFFEDLINCVGDIKMQGVLVEGLQLLLKYVNKSKKVYPELEGKLKTIKEARNNIQSSLQIRLKGIMKSLQIYEKNHITVESIKNELDDLSIQKKEGDNESKSSYETIDDDEDDYEDYDDLEDEDGMDEEVEEKEEIEEEESNPLTHKLNSKLKGANAQNTIQLEYNNENDPDSINNGSASAGPAAPPYVDYTEFYFTDEQQQQMAGAAAAPGP